MSDPSLADYLEAASATYTGATPPDLTLLTTSPESEISSGFSAEAFVDSAGDVIVAFEGTSPNPLTSFGRGTLTADAQIFLGQIPAAFTEAESFVQQVELDDNIASSDIYVTGHSLGGAEAEAVVATVPNLGGGVTFGAPGISLLNLRTNLDLTNYVDYGDPIGNFGTDTAAGATYTPQGIQHVGQVVMVGSPSDGTALSIEGIIYTDLTSVLSDPIVNALIGEEGDLLVAAALVADLTAVGVNQLPFHSLPNNYFPDLGYSLSSDGTAFPFGPGVPEYPATFGADQLSNIPYASSSDVVSSSGQLQELSVTDTDNTSNVVNFGANGSLLVDSSFDANGNLTDTIQVNDDDSELDTFYGPSGSALSTTAFDFSSSGQLTSTVATLANGSTVTFDQGAYSSLNYDPTGLVLSAMLATPDGTAAGALAVTAGSASTGTLTLANGDQIAFAGNANIEIPSSTPDQFQLRFATASTGSATNEVDIDGSTTIGTNVFSIAEGSSGNDVIVGAVSNDSAGTPATYGVDVTNPGNIVVTGGSGDVLNLNDGLNANFSSLKVVDSGTISETLVENSNGSVSFKDETGHVFETFAAGSLTNGTVEISGNEIASYVGGQIQNSTQTVDLGNGVTGVLDTSYGPGYSFSSIDDPNATNSEGAAQTLITGVSDTGLLAGDSTSAPLTFVPGVGYVSGYNVGLVDQNGAISYFSPQGPSSTPVGFEAYSYTGNINESGTAIVGTYNDFPGYNPSSQGFEYSGGVFSYIVDPNDVPYLDTYHTYAEGVNDSGTIVGYYAINSSDFGLASATEVLGFIDNGGIFSDLVYPGSTGTLLTGINDEGVIVGDTAGSGIVGLYGFEGAFFYEAGTFQKINDPDAWGGETALTGINDSNEMVGYYRDGNGANHGFIYQNGAFTTVDVPGATDTVVTAINNNGEIVGYYTDGNGVYYGFTAIPDNALATVATSTLEVAKSGVIDLRGSQTSAPSQTINLASGDSTVYAGDASEIINGSGGGFNRVVYDFASTGALTRNGNGSWTISAPSSGETFTLSNIQVVQFTDRTISLQTPTRDDFTAAGVSDVLYRNDSTGDTGFYNIVNGTNTSWRDIGASSTAYTVVGTGDFTGDGTTDVLYRNNTTGDTGFYSIVNGSNVGWNDVGGSSTAYNVVGVGDFTGNGIDDVLYRDNATGDTGFYEIVNGVNVGWHDVGASSTAYSVVGVGDFMGDGTDDILYRDNTTGDTGFYDIVNGVNAGWHDVGASSIAYSVVGVGDFMGNGTDDILYRNNTTGDTGFYDIVNGVNTGWHDIGASSTAYSVVATDDYLGNGTSDVLFRDNTTGDTGFYEIVNGVNNGWHDVGASSTAYHVVS